MDSWMDGEQNGDAKLEPVPPVPGFETVVSPQLTKLTVNLIRSADIAMNVGAERTGMTRTDFVNRAIIFYAEMIERVQGGWEIFEKRDVVTHHRFWDTTKTLTRRVVLSDIMATSKGKA